MYFVKSHVVQWRPESCVCAVPNVKTRHFYLIGYAYCLVLYIFVSPTHLIQGPDGWEDVLTPRRMRGRCHTTNCRGNTAVSSHYFLCIYQYCMADDKWHWCCCCCCCFRSSFSNVPITIHEMRTRQYHCT